MFSELVRVRAKLASIAASTALVSLGFAFDPVNADASQITYQQVLAAPDDAKLNLDYARQQVASGRLQQAAAALERLLLAQPNWDSVRLFYGFVLFRLGDMIGARREFELLEGRGLSADQEASRKRYLALASKKSNALRITSRYTIGGRYDTNPGRVSDAIAAATIASQDDDFAFSASSRFRIEKDLGNGRGDYLFFQSNGLLQDYFDIHRADRANTRARAGVKLHGDRVKFTPYAQVGTSWLKYEKFQQGVGGGVDVDWSLSSQVALRLHGQAIDETYFRTGGSTIGGRRNGVRYSTGARVQWRVSDSLRLLAGLTHRTKDARDDGFSYDSNTVSVAARKLFGKGLYMSLSASATRIEFDQPDNVYSSTVTRKDDRYRLRAAVGAPLSTLLPDAGLPKAIADIVAQVGTTYQDQDSTINQLDIENFSVDVTFTKRFSF